MFSMIQGRWCLESPKSFVQYNKEIFFSLIMPKASLVQKSGFRFNITEPYIDIRYTAAASACELTLVKFPIILLLIIGVQLI